MSRTYTSVYWLGSEVQRTVFEADSDGEAFEEHDQNGWNAYDDRQLLAGDVSLEDLEARRAR